MADEEDGWSWGGAGTGAVAGATAGGLYGSVVPGIGTAIGAGIGMVGGAIWGGFTGGEKKKKQQVYDPLGPIRQQLIALAQAGLPVEAMKGQIREEYGVAREKGLRDIGEEVYAAKELPGSIHASLVTDLVERLARGERSAMLDVDVAQKRYQVGALRTAMGGGIPPEAGPEGPGIWEQALPVAGEMAGTYLGEKTGTESLEKLLKTQRDAETKKREELEEEEGVIVKG